MYSPSSSKSQQSQLFEMNSVYRDVPHGTMGQARFSIDNEGEGTPTESIAKKTDNFGHRIQNHLKRWKEQRLRKQLESHLIIVQRAKELKVDTCPEISLSRSQSLSSLSDIGRTLFSPLDGPFQTAKYDNEESLISNKVMVNKLDDSDVSTEESREDETEETLVTNETFTSKVDAVHTEESHKDDDNDDVTVLQDYAQEECPFLLTMDMMRQLRQSMPLSAQMKVWKRIYSVARDGDTFRTFLNTVKGHRQTLLCIQTASGEVFGGFAEAHWGQLAMRTDGSYYGTGRSFLFSAGSSLVSNVVSASPQSVDGLPEPSRVDHVCIHPWQGVNEYSILCSVRDGGRVAMGGGGTDGSFGFCVQEHFTQGSSGPCATFGNKTSLSRSTHFEVINFEVYGFVNNW